LGDGGDHSGKRKEDEEHQDTTEDPGPAGSSAGCNVQGGLAD
jgi:hypothetical protein